MADITAKARDRVCLQPAYSRMHVSDVAGAATLRVPIQPVG